LWGDADGANAGHGDALSTEPLPHWLCNQTAGDLSLATGHADVYLSLPFEPHFEVCAWKKQGLTDDVGERLEFGVVRQWSDFDRIAFAHWIACFVVLLRLYKRDAELRQS
jgi:hypothetical protein